MFKQATNYVVT